MARVRQINNMTLRKEITAFTTRFCVYAPDGRRLLEFCERADAEDWMNKVKDFTKTDAKGHLIEMLERHDVSPKERADTFFDVLCTVHKAMGSGEYYTHCSSVQNVDTGKDAFRRVKSFRGEGARRRALDYNKAEVERLREYIFFCFSGDEGGDTADD